MALGEFIKDNQEVIDNFEERNYPDLTGAVMSFSKITDMKVPQYVYKGDEKMPFTERDPEYQKIFIAEFISG